MIKATVAFPAKYYNFDILNFSVEWLLDVFFKEIRSTNFY